MVTKTCNPAPNAKCPVVRCQYSGPLTWHHILPQRFSLFFPDFQEHLIAICRSCHDEIEQYIPLYEPKDRGFYFNLVQWFTEATELSSPGKTPVKVGQSCNRWYYCPYCTFQQRKKFRGRCVRCNLELDDQVQLLPFKPKPLVTQFPLLATLYDLQAAA